MTSAPLSVVGRRARCGAGARSGWGVHAGGRRCATIAAMAKKPKAPEGPPAPFHAPFAGLAGKLGLPCAPPAPAPSPEAAPKVKPAPARAVVRMEKKGRGGKVVTVVEKLALAPPELEAWLADLKRALGCGGAVEGDAIVLQGDSRERVGALLEARGVRKVTVA